MSDLLMRGRILRILTVGLSPLLQRRRHNLDLVERWQPSNETGFRSFQAGRGPPWRSSTYVVGDSSFAPLINNRKLEGYAMMKYRTVALAVVGLFLSVSFLASPVVAVEKDGVMMKNGKMTMMQDGKEVTRMDRETTLSDGTKVMMNGKMVMKGGKEVQMKEGQMVMMDGKMMESGKSMASDKDMKMEKMDK
jgi:hypothetical protein